MPATEPRQEVAVMGFFAIEQFGMGDLMAPASQAQTDEVMLCCWSGPMAHGLDWAFEGSSVKNGMVAAAG